MQFQISQRKIINDFILESRGFSKLLVLLPGFAFDYKIFSFLDLPFDYLYPRSLITIDAIDRLKELLLDIRHNFKAIYLLGWSLGGNIALLLYKDIPFVFSSISLVSIRNKYLREDISKQISMLREDHDKMLKDFYRKCFLGQKSFFYWFRHHLEKEYLYKFSTAKLIRQLTFLENDYIELSYIKTRLLLFHGKRDLIAPLDDIPEIPYGAKRFILKSASHIPFLDTRFTKLFLENI